MSRPPSNCCVCGKERTRPYLQCGLSKALQVIRDAQGGKKPDLLYSLRAQDPRTKKLVKVPK